MSRIYGITGGIATGKSLVSKLIRERGFEVFNADEISHDVTNKSDIIQKLEKAFSVDLKLDNGKLNRNKVAKIVFNDDIELKKLNNIVGPSIRKKLLEIINDIKKDIDDKVYFIEIPLLFEMNYEEFLNGSILVYADKKVQLKRLMERDNIDEEYALAKISKQFNLAKKVELADYVINNSTSKEEVEIQVEKLLFTLIEQGKK